MFSEEVLNKITSLLSVAMDPFVCVDDYERYALSFLPKKNLDFYRSGAGAESTLRDNKMAFSRYRIRPRVLRDVSKRDLSTTVLGQKVALPIGIAPTSLQKMAHPDGEIASAKAVEALGTIFILSSASTTSMEDIAEAAPKCVKWFQLYVLKDRNLTRNMVERAEKCGFKALVLTVDLPVLGIRLEDIRNKFTIPTNLEYANFKDLAKRLKDGMSLASYLNSISDASLQWEDIKWLKVITSLPIILKGILTAEDALLALDAKVDGIVVSNHGGRQLDSTLATIDVLPEIVEVVGDRMEVYLDGGIRDGTDVFKALALGARMVFIGRPILWGLSYDGQKGVQNIFEILRKELDTTLALSGCCTPGDIKPEMVVHKNCIAKM